MGLVMELFLVLASKCHDTLGPYWTILFVRYSTNQTTLDIYSIQDSYILLYNFFDSLHWRILCEQEKDYAQKIRKIIM
jgi:hypothetical protein